MAEEIHFKFGHFRNFEGPVTLTLTSDELESHIVAHLYQYHIMACGYIAFDCGRTDGNVFTNGMSHLCSSAEMTNKVNIYKIGIIQLDIMCTNSQLISIGGSLSVWVGKSTFRLTRYHLLAKQRT